MSPTVSPGGGRKLFDFSFNFGAATVGDQLVGIPLRIALPEGAVDYWQDIGETIRAVNHLDPVRVYRDTSGRTTCVAIAPDDSLRMTLLIIGGKAVLRGPGLLITNIDTADIPEAHGYSVAYATNRNGTAVTIAARGAGGNKFLHFTGYGGHRTFLRYGGPGFTIPDTIAWAKVSYVYDDVGLTEKFWWDGNEAASASFGGGGDNGFICIGGSNDSYQFQSGSYISSLFLSDISWTTEQRQRVEAAMVIPAENANTLNFLGNSITEGFNASDRTFPTGNSFADLAVQGVSASVKSYNFGQAGATSDVVYGQSLILIRSKHQAVAVIGEQVNDIHNRIVSGDTDAEAAQYAYDGLGRVCRTAKAAGAKVILWNCVIDDSSTDHAAKLLSQAQFRADFPTTVSGIIKSGADYADLFVDFGLLDWNGLMGDHLHPDTAGHAVMAQHILQAINILL